MRHLCSLAELYKASPKANQLYNHLGSEDHTRYIRFYENAPISTSFLSMVIQYYYNINITTDALSLSKQGTSLINKGEKTLDEAISDRFYYDYDKPSICLIDSPAKHIFKKAIESEKYEYIERYTKLIQELTQNKDVVICKHNKTLYLFMSNPDYDLFNDTIVYLLCILPLVNELKSSDEELPNLLIDILNGDDKDEYKDRFLELINKIDFRTETINIMQTKLIDVFKSKNEEQATINLIRRYEDQIEEYYNKISELQAEIYSYRMKLLNKIIENPEELTEEIIDYIQSNKNIFDIQFNKSDEILKIFIKAPLIYYDSDVVDTYIHKDNENYLNQMSNLMKELFIKTFVENEYQLYTYSVIEVNFQYIASFFRGSEYSFSYMIHAAQNNSVPNINCIANPHLMQFNCFGGNQNEIITSLRNKNLLNAIAQTVASAQNINFTDTTVGRQLITNISRNKSLKMFKNKRTGELFSFNDFKEDYENETNQS